MNIQSYPLKGGQYFHHRIPKKYVVWHGTAGRTRNTPVYGKPGQATTTIDGWNTTPDRVGAPWLVDRDGTIYKTFDDRLWIYHLGLKGTNGRYDQSSVAIEFANEVALELDGDRFHAFGALSPTTVYTGKVLSSPWRGYQHFAEADEAQIDAGIELTLDICRRHDITPTFYYPSTTFDFPRCFQIATIVCHSNCRADKADLWLPAWVYEKIRAAGIRLVS